MNRTIEDIQKDIELLGIKGGYDIEQLITPQDCRRLSYEISRLNTDKYLLEQKLQQKENIIKEVREYANNIMFESKVEEKIQDDILEILDKENRIC